MSHQLFNVQCLMQFLMQFLMLSNTHVFNNLPVVIMSLLAAWNLAIDKILERNSLQDAKETLKQNKN